MAAATRVSSNGKRGLKAAFGELLIAANGVWVLNDPAGKQVAAATAPPKLSMEHGTGSEGGQRPGITMAVTGSKTGPGANGRRPCLVNGGWGFVKMHIGPPPRILFSRTLRGCAVLRV